MSPPRYVPSGWPTVIPRIVARDAEDLVAFIVRVFEASGAWASGRPSELRIGDSMVMVSEAGPRDATPAFLYVYVADTDATYARALAAGARAIETPAIVPYGDRRAMVEDRWGNVWQIATHLG